MLSIFVVPNYYLFEVNMPVCNLIWEMTRAIQMRLMHIRQQSLSLAYYMQRQSQLEVFNVLPT